jgi:hypothetical protein
LAHTCSVLGIPATAPWFFTVIAALTVALALGLLGVKTTPVTTKSGVGAAATV